MLIFSAHNLFFLSSFKNIDDFTNKKEVKEKESDKLFLSFHFWLSFTIIDNGVCKLFNIEATYNAIIQNKVSIKVCITCITTNYK